MNSIGLVYSRWPLLIVGVLYFYHSLAMLMPFVFYPVFHLSRNVPLDGTAEFPLLSPPTLAETTLNRDLGVFDIARICLVE